MTADERLARVEVRFDGLEKDMRELTEYVHGPPRDGSLRGRVYRLEGNDAAAKAATAALAAARAMQGNRLSKKQSWLVAVGGCVVALCAMTTTAVVLVQALG